MKLSIMPKRTASELLFFLAENEEFPSISKNFGDQFTSEEVRALLREISEGLMKESAKEAGDGKMDKESDPYLSEKTKEVLSYLSPHEEKTLLEAFGLTEKT